MDLDNGYSVDPVLKAHIVNLVSALGGPDITQVEKPYKLGDDALACLRDIRRWLRMYEEDGERWDVQRAIADTSLVAVDLVEILTQWELKSEECREGAGKHFDRIALACLELLVPLTWPIELSRETSNKNHFINAPHLARARLTYKRAILTHVHSRVLKAVLRLALPSLKVPMFKRGARDEGIIKLVVFFFRNLLAIDSNAAARAGYAASMLDKSEEDVSRSTTIVMFQKQNVLKFFLMLGSEMGRSFIEQDSSLLEGLFHLLKGIVPRSLYGKSVNGDKIGFDADILTKLETNRGENITEIGEGEENFASLGDLQSLLELDKQMKNKGKRHGASRHSRFGTLVTMEFANDKKMVISGADGLSSFQNTMNKLDSTKKWNRPNRSKGRDNERWNLAISLQKDAADILRGFVEQFMDAAFNPFFVQLRKLMEDNSNRLLQVHKLHYLYLMSWFLDLFRCRSLYTTEENYEIDYGLVGAALNQRTFSMCARLLDEAYKTPVSLDESGNASGIIYTSMLCFKEIFLTIRDMEKNGSQDDQDIAENIKMRLFYEESILNELSDLPNKASSHSLAYMRACIQLSHVLLRMLEKYAEQHTSLWVRSRRKRSKRKKAIANAEDDTGDLIDDIGDVSEDEQESPEEEARRITQERKWNFVKFQARYISESAIDTYITFLSTNDDINEEEVSMCISYFVRAFVKCEARAVFYRLDFMRSLQKLVAKLEGVPRTNKVRRDTEKFTVFFMRRLEEALDRTPSLFVELLFPKQRTDIYYYNHGYDKTIDKPNRVYEWTFKKDSLPLERKIAFVVAALIDTDNGKMVEWLNESVSRVVSKQRDYYDNNLETNRVPFDQLKVTEPVWLEYPEDTDQFGKNAYFRLLARLCGLDVSIEEEHKCFVPANTAHDSLETALKYLKRYMFEPVEFPEGQTAADQLSRRYSSLDIISPPSDDEAALSEDEQFIDDRDVDEDEIDGLNDSRFAALPEDERLARLMFIKGEKAREKPPKKRATKRRNKDDDDEEITMKKRRAATDKEDAERKKLLKSTAFVNDSDDETDDERDTQFFAREKRLREEYHRKEALAATQATQSQILTSELSGPTPAPSSDPARDNRSSLELELTNSDEENERDVLIGKGSDAIEPLKSFSITEHMVLDGEVVDEDSDQADGPVRPRFASRRVVLDDDDEEE